MTRDDITSQWIFLSPAIWSLEKSCFHVNLSCFLFFCGTNLGLRHRATLILGDARSANSNTLFNVHSHLSVNSMVRLTFQSSYKQARDCHWKPYVVANKLLFLWELFLFCISKSFNRIQRSICRAFCITTNGNCETNFVSTHSFVFTRQHRLPQPQ